MALPFHWIVPAGLAFSTCLGLGVLGIRLAPKFGLLDIPGGRRQHAAPIPRVGGPAAMVALLIISLAAGYRMPLTRLEAWAVAGMAVVGFLDDRYELRARWKALFGLALALALASGAMHHMAGSLTSYELLGIWIPPMPGIAFFLLAFLFWGVPQAFNLIDGANGLATGFGLVVIGSLWATGIPHPLIGACLLACLLLNWPRAKLFLGDCGSLTIGLILAIYSQKSLGLPAPNRLLWLFAYPSIDVLTVIIIRAAQRRPIFVGDRSHLHHQLADRWPSLAFFSVPLLLGLAALCASQVYATGYTLVASWLGLFLLLGMAAYFILSTLLGWTGSAATDFLDKDARAVGAE